MSGKIETGCYFDLSEYLCWQKYRKAFSSLYKKSIGETSCWKEKNYSLNRTTVFIVIENSLKTHYQTLTSDMF